jgi:predicted nucleotidyltransferase
MTSLITPGKQYAHLDAETAKNTLLMFARLEPQSFNIKMSQDQSVIHSDPFDFYRDFFIEMGLIERVNSGGFQLTKTGIDLATGQIRDPISRDDAVKEIKAIRERADWVLDDPDQIFYARSVFIFGSYVDTDKAMLGDLDVGVSFGLKPEYRRMADEQLGLIARSIQKRASAGKDESEVANVREWAKERMLRHIHAGNDFISLHASHELPTLRIQNALWVYDSNKALSEPLALSKKELVTINHYLSKSM